MADHETVPYTALPAYSDVERIARARAFYEAIRTRRTCRDFADIPVPRQVIEQALLAAGSAPNGANHQPWHFAVIASPDKKRAIREAAEAEEREFYAGKASEEWLEALAPLGTDEVKEYLEIAPWLIVVFAQRWGEFDDGTRYKNYYVPESVNIATGFLLAALHDAGLVTLTHTPNPMKFLAAALNRPASEKPTMIIAVGHPAEHATVPEVAKMKKTLDQISSFFD